MQISVPGVQKKKKSDHSLCRKEASCNIFYKQLCIVYPQLFLISYPEGLTKKKTTKVAKNWFLKLQDAALNHHLWSMMKERNLHTEIQQLSAGIFSTERNLFALIQFFQGYQCMSLQRTSELQTNVKIQVHRKSIAEQEIFLEKYLIPFPVTIDLYLCWQLQNSS